jgi:1,2-diacylglycerol 3-beta-glucosyltransferase
VAVSAPRAGGFSWLVAAAGVLLVAGGLLGAGRLAIVLFLGIQAANMVFFLRHLVFVAAATQAPPRDGTPGPANEAAGGYLPAATVLVACHNEETVVEPLVAALGRLDYPRERIQIIVIDDGSADRTGELLDELTAGADRIEVLHRPAGAGGGKSGALNFARSHVRGEVVIVFDADHRPHAEVVRRLVRHFADPEVGAVQGRCRIHNGSTSPIAELVEIDYLAGYLVNEFGRDRVYRLPAYGGANCAVRASSLTALGGWNEHSVTEDTDLTLRLVLRGQRVRYDVTAVDEEEAVTTLRRYWRQRYRWARGHQQVWRDYRAAVWRSRHLPFLAKIETTMFLLIFHTPVLSGLGMVLLLAWMAGAFRIAPGFDGYIFAFWTLLFLGPFMEFGTGLLLASGPRRRVGTLVLFVPMFFVGVALCTKAWFDGKFGRRYTWAKTARAGQSSSVPASADAAQEPRSPVP